MGTIARRDFLKAASVAAGAVPLVAAAKRGAGADVRIAGTSYTPIQDYPIRPKPHSEVTIADRFWKPKIETNAKVTIPFEVEKLSETGRGFAGNVLEAAMLSLK